MDWKSMGFTSEKDYKDFLAAKLKSLKLILNEPKIKAVFKRLYNR